MAGFIVVQIVDKALLGPNVKVDSQISNLNHRFFVLRNTISLTQLSKANDRCIGYVVH